MNSEEHASSYGPTFRHAHAKKSSLMCADGQDGGANKNSTHDELMTTDDGNARDRDYTLLASKRRRVEHTPANSIV